MYFIFWTQLKVHSIDVTGFNQARSSIVLGNYHSDIVTHTLFEPLVASWVAMGGFTDSDDTIGKILFIVFFNVIQ
jgi:hypothetical protein